MRRLAIRTIDLMLSPLAQSAWLVLVLLSSCAAPFSGRKLDAVEPWVKSVTELPHSELQDVCGKSYDVMACVNIQFGQIYIAEGMPPRRYQCLLNHEKSHLYEVHVMGKTVAQTVAHENWVTTWC